MESEQMTAKQLRAAIVELGGIPRGTKVTGDDGLRAQYESWLESSQSPGADVSADPVPFPEGAEGVNPTPAEVDGEVVTFEDDTAEAAAAVEVRAPAAAPAVPTAEVKKGKIPITKVKIPGSKFIRVIKGMSPDDGGRSEARRRWGSNVEILN